MSRVIKSDDLSSITSDSESKESDEVDDYGVPAEASNDEKINGIMSTLRKQCDQRFVKTSILSPTHKKRKLVKSDSINLENLEEKLLLFKSGL